MEAPIPDHAITMAFLSRCDPPVKLLDPSEVKTEAPLPQAVSELLDKIEDIPLGTIPRQYKADYDRRADTPRKSFKAPNARNYTTEEISSLSKAFVDRWIFNTQINHEISALERQWTGDSVASVLSALEVEDSEHTWKKLNVEDCPIEPWDLRVQRVVPDVIFPSNEEKSKTSLSKPKNTKTTDSSKVKSRGKTDKDSQKDVAPEPGTISKMVDYSAALMLGKAITKQIDKAMQFYPEGARSLNQTLGSFCNFPIFLDIEVKKEYKVENPEIQLAIWAAGALQKKRYHGWDTSFPMPGITVRGPHWTGYIFFERDGELVRLSRLFLVFLWGWRGF